MKKKSRNSIGYQQQYSYGAAENLCGIFQLDLPFILKSRPDGGYSIRGFFVCRGWAVSPL